MNQSHDGLEVLLRVGGPEPGVQRPDTIERPRARPAGKSMKVQEDFDAEVCRCFQDLLQGMNWDAYPLIRRPFEPLWVKGRIVPYWFFLGK